MSAVWLELMRSSLGGLIGGEFAVLGMAVNGRRERHRDRQQRIHENLNTITVCLLGRQDLVRDYDPQGRLPEDAGRRHSQLIDQLRHHVALIDDNGVRERLLPLSRVISDPNTIENFHGDNHRLATMNACQHSLAVIARIRTDEPFPAEPDFLPAYRVAFEDMEEVVYGPDGDHSRSRSPEEP